ncbi:MAG: GNAT family N-acetyltransferase [Ktedonobacterales bacterium]
MATELPLGYTTRVATLGDAGAVRAVMEASASADAEEPAFTREELLGFWQAPGLDLALDTRLVLAPDGSAVAYGGLSNTAHAELGGYITVHPRHRARGIGTLLVRGALERAREHAALADPAARVTLGYGVPITHGPAQRIAAREGFAAVRRFWRMRIALPPVGDNATPAPAAWPAGITPRIAVPEDERAVYGVIVEAFAGHWGAPVPSFVAWRQRAMEHEDFDPSLWLLALAGNELAGCALCRMREGGGWVDELGVRPGHRGQGIGLALLRAAFAEFQRRGVRTVGLAVDAENTTGATRLYERAGMRAYQAWDAYHKTIRGATDAR